MPIILEVGTTQFSKYTAAVGWVFQPLDLERMQQSLPHLLGEHAGEASGGAVARTLALQVRQERDRAAEGALAAQRAGLKAALLEAEGAHDAHVKALRLEQDRAQAELRADFERRLRELHAVYDDRQARLREDMGRAREEEVRRGTCARAR